MNEQKSTKNKFLHTYQVNLVNTNGSFIDVESVKLKLEMKSMNHHVNEKMKKVKNGVYEVKLELPMEGNWVKQVTLKQGKNERIINIR